MQVKMANIDTLKAHPMNPRVHPESAIDKLECSIKEFGRIMDWKKLRLFCDNF